jgi:hypothetical protein
MLIVLGAAKTVDLCVAGAPRMEEGWLGALAKSSQAREVEIAAGAGDPGTRAGQVRLPKMVFWR